MRITAALALVHAESALDRLLIIPAPEEEILWAYIVECAARVRYEWAETYRQHRLAVKKWRWPIPPAYAHRNQHTGKTHCVNGHEFTLENTKILKGGSRKCRTCAKIEMRRQCDRLKAATAARRATARCCANGHEFNAENTRVFRNGYLRCQACARAATLRELAKKRAATVTRRAALLCHQSGLIRCT